MRLSKYYVIVDYGGRRFFRGRSDGQPSWSRRHDKAFRYASRSAARRMLGKLEAQYPGLDLGEISGQGAWAQEQIWERGDRGNGYSDSVHG